jgi:hypothetical protein
MVLFSVTVLLGIAFNAEASSSLSFEGGGYWLDMEVGEATVPVIASVQFHRPGDAAGVILRSNVLDIEAFDLTHHVLVIRYPGRGGADAVEPFVLSVYDARAVLHVDGRCIVSQFNWSM